MKKITFISFALLVSFASFAAPSGDLANEPQNIVRRSDGGGACTSNADCNYQGQCTTGGSCVCAEGFTDSHCSYREHDQSTAFFLHVLFGWAFGAGDFYIGENGKGGAHVGLFWGGTVLGAVGKALGGAETTPGKALGFVAGITLLANGIWWLVDAIRFARNEIDDSDDRELKEW